MSDDGATPRELLLESCRRNNAALLADVLERVSGASGNKEEEVARLLNTATDGVGRFCLHVAAGCGSYEVLDTLLDQEGLEVDPVDRLDADIPLHKAVRFVNSLSKEEWEAGASLVELLLDAGADPRIRNKAKLKPCELVDPRNTELRATLQKAEFAMLAGDDVIGRDGEDEQGPTGSASDSE
ncbi:hypothetical protein IMSHALPRED_002995 [Imshaugia aleurites]|uniref:Ankyrin repeat protein n=1 Tax=Imshaugia aleurites TaxID=172621 RepID=A0A8H3F132_9LECA|nr:hypothetical protein IMSHALPRED_002995 [Imshaugia aleurites]